ncbi:MAG: hypothetical protein MJZ02_09030 [Paludibacteraceae bacterium]|nr:hypothetical protein [Paludibacteraceae bacterium]
MKKFVLPLMAATICGLNSSAQTVSGQVGNHNYVDLGLPSGTKWATCNIGGSKPTDDGDYFAWAETEPKKNYTWYTYKWCKGTKASKTKYITMGFNTEVDHKLTLDETDDAATVNWGKEWRTPTVKEADELLQGCNWTWDADYKGSGLSGRIGTSKTNGNVIFIPASGYRDSTDAIGVSDIGCYWSSSLDEDDTNAAHYLDFNIDDIDWFSSNRSTGRSVRAVVK